jgi:hypothetical protein
MIHQRKMRIPTGDIAKSESGPFTVTSGNVTNPIFRFIKDGFFTAIASAPF